MAFTEFEDSIAWQKAQHLMETILVHIEPLKAYWLKDQTYRAGTSISNNIAEGFERQYDKEFIQFLFYSLGSCGEVRSMLHLAIRLKYLSENTALELIEKAREISRIIRGLIKYLKTNK